jgi:thiol-disulfide isomerase/thioredoxin
MKKNKIYYLSIITSLIMGCYQNVSVGTPPAEELPTPLKGDSYKKDAGVLADTNISEAQDNLDDSDVVEDVLTDGDKDSVKVDISAEEMLPPAPSYPDGPYSLELFKIVPDMTFYNPWSDKWFSISELFQHEKNKAFILVSSAGWCGPCLAEAAALINVYNKYHEDGLEIIYTLGNTNIPGDVPFDTTAGDINSAGFASDLKFMESWQFMTQDEADMILPYQMYADPNREFIKYLPQHAWPLSLLITTKDMGIRLVEEGYWSVLMENKIMLVLYNEVPNLPFE